ncbi:hypothetical protein ABPG72_018886 [Tetrahymena utriculariae]
MNCLNNFLVYFSLLVFIYQSLILLNIQILKDLATPIQLIFIFFTTQKIQKIIERTNQSFQMEEQFQKQVKANLIILIKIYRLLHVFNQKYLDSLVQDEYLAAKKY